MVRRKHLWIVIPLMVLALVFAFPGTCLADDGAIVDSLKYDRSIHIMMMLLMGFGFLMVFVRKYGRSALTATFLVVSVTIPFYFLLDNTGVFGEVTSVEIDRLIFAEFAAASLVICSGACLGRMKMVQYIVLALLFVPVYMMNEWITLENGWGLIASGAFVDTGGSMVIHAFGAIFGLGVVMAMTKIDDLGIPIESDFTSDRFSLLGSMALWIFWPSFCSALVAPELVPFTAVNVVLALTAATLSTYVVSVILRRKISVVDIANASLAGGVAIGSTCATASHPIAFLIGILAGVLATIGFVVIQPKLERTLKMIDTCGVTNLHGWPGVLGGIAAVFVVDGISPGSQFAGIGITIGIALAAGYVVGLIVSALGRIKKPYDDAAEFVNVEAEG